MISSGIFNMALHFCKRKGGGVMLILRKSTSKILKARKYAKIIFKIELNFIYFLFLYFRWLSTMSSELKVKFIPTANKIIVPHRLLREPYYEPDYPIAVLYGTLGVEIAREMVSSLLKYSALYSSNGTLINNHSLVANLSLTAIDHQLKCINDFCVQNEISDAKTSNRTSLNTFINISAVKQASKVCKIFFFFKYLIPF